MRPAWTAEALLPGGEIGDHAAFEARLLADYPYLDTGQARRFARTYGTLCRAFLDGRDSQAALGEAFGAGLTAAEVDYLIEREWARSAEDILWRRTKLALRLTESERQRLVDYLEATVPLAASGLASTGASPRHPA